MSGRLVITDGTTTVDLLQQLRLRKWTPQLPRAKGGGIWRSSPFLHGRQLILQKYDNPVDTFDLIVSDCSQDGLIGMRRILRNLLEKGVNYWTSTWADSPVWIEAKGINETNVRYAYISDFQALSDSDPFQQPLNIDDEFTLILEHTLWQEDEPDTLNPLSVSAMNESLTGTDYGQAESDSDQMYISNFFSRGIIDYIYVYDASLGNYSNVAGLYPATILPAVPAVGDMVYFGITDTAFNNVVLNIDSIWGGAGAGHTGVWEYSLILGGWATLGVIDDTDQEGHMTGNAFDTAGRNSVWVENDNHTAWAVNGRTKYWIRYRITAVDGGTPNVPPTISEAPYTVNTPYIDVDSSFTGGDLRSLLYTSLQCHSADEQMDVGYAPQGIVAGVRSKDRGEFNAYINISENQQPAGVVITPSSRFSAPSDTAWGSDGFLYSTAGTGYSFGDTIPIAQIIIPPTYNYEGTYKAYLRGVETDITDPPNEFFIRWGYTNPLASKGAGATFGEDGLFAIGESARGVMSLIDLGQITIAPSNMLNNGYLRIDILMQYNDDTIVQLYDLILIPVDESAFFAYNTNTKLTRANTDGDYPYGLKTMLQVDSITYPKRNIKGSHVINDDTLPIAGIHHLTNWVTPSTGPFTLASAGDQRIWFFMIEDINDYSYPTNDGYMMWQPLISSLSYKTNRYLSARGNS